MNVAVSHGVRATGEPWVRCVKPCSKARLRLFCFPYAGGGRSVYRAWPGDLWPGVEVCPVQLPGREDRSREPAFTDLDALIEALEHALLPYLDVPFALFGHSMGALISFELTRRLRRRHALEPMHLFLSGRRAAQIPHRGPIIHCMPEPQLIEELRRLNGTPEEALENARLMRQVLPTLRADFAVCETYRYRDDAPLDCPITALGGLRDPMTSRDDLAAWQRHTRGAFIQRMFPGDHFFMHGTHAQLMYTMTPTLIGLADREPRSVCA